MSLKREFMKKGPFERSENGDMMALDSYAKAMAIMAKHVWIKYSINRKDILENRYGLYQDRRFKEYDKMISTQVTKYVRETDMMMDKALIYLSIEQKVFKSSHKLFFKNGAAQVLMDEIYQRELLETWT